MTTPFTASTTAFEVIDGVDLTGQHAVVTGGTSGIGAETVRALALAGAEVTVATRRPETVGALARELSGIPGAGRVRAQALELSDLSSVRAFTAAWQGPLDILVANAGIMALPERVTTAEGWEMQLGTNFLGHFALAGGLLSSLQASGPARVVIVSSGAHRAFPFNFDDPQFEQRPYDPWVAYGQSKTADVLFAVGARRWSADGIMANAVNPGYVLTNLQRHLDDDTLRSFGVMDDDGNVTPLSYYKTPSQGAAGSVLLAASPLTAGVTGRYFENNQEAEVVPGDQGEASGVAAHAVDPAAADRLWEYATETISR
ncbi:SDR family NAD(P)-dependent oxidoreductase [Streptomyces sp. NPDC097941]|uniref:SDR family NAD(P)-dependent oxidoreductase n=1 Tax=Streptomyces sp. NPDC097941 TaxID=3155685 RepID=UPI00332CD5CB